MEPGFPAQFKQFCEATRTQYIIAGPGTPPALLAVIENLAWPERKIDDVLTFQVPGG
jgi:hypothetical protein